MSFLGETKLTPKEWLQYAIKADFPLKPLPAGVSPDFETGHTTAGQLYMAAGVCIPLVAIFGSFRLLYAMKLKRKILIADEIVFGLGFGLCLAFIAMTLAGVNHCGYLGRHAWDSGLAEATLRTIMLTIWVQALAPLAICAVKVSALTLYLRVYGGPRLWLRAICVVSIILLLGYHISLATALGVMCVSGQFRGVRVLIMSMIYGNGLIDLVLLNLPLPVMWTLFWTTLRKPQNSPGRELKMVAVSMIGILCVPTVLSTLLLLLNF